MNVAKLSILYNPPLYTAIESLNLDAIFFFYFSSFGHSIVSFILLSICFICSIFYSSKIQIRQTTTIFFSFIALFCNYPDCNVPQIAEPTVSVAIVYTSFFQLFLNHSRWLLCVPTQFNRIFSKCRLAQMKRGNNGKNNNNDITFTS